MSIDGGIHGVGEVGDRNRILVGVAYGDVKVGVAILVAVLVAHVGKHRALHAVFVDIDTLVEPRFLEFECVLGVVADFNRGVCGFVFNGDFADFDAIDDFVLFARVFRAERHLEKSAVKPGAAKIRNAVQVLACDNREVLPEGAFGHLGAFDESAQGIALGLVLFGNGLFPVVVEFLFAYAEDLLDGTIEREAVVLGHFMPDLGHGVFAVFLADVTHQRETLRVGTKFCKQRIFRKFVHVGEREQTIVQGCHAE